MFGVGHGFRDLMNLTLLSRTSSGQDKAGRLSHVNLSVLVRKRYHSRQLLPFQEFE